MAIRPLPLSAAEAAFGWTACVNAACPAKARGPHAHMKTLSQVCKCSKAATTHGPAGQPWCGAGAVCPRPW